MRLKGKGAGLKFVEDYRTDQLVDDIKFLTKGYHKFSGDFWQQVTNCESETTGRYTRHLIDKDMIPSAFINEYLIDEEQSFAGKIVEVTDDKMAVQDLGYERLMGRNAWGIHPKNIYQGMAMDALLDPEIDLAILTGPAGCGKTGITSTIMSIFVQTSVKVKSLAQFLQINIIKNLSFTNQINTYSKLSLGECYV